MICWQELLFECDCSHETDNKNNTKNRKNTISSFDDESSKSFDTFKFTFTNVNTYKIKSLLFCSFWRDMINFKLRIFCDIFRCVFTLQRYLPQLKSEKKKCVKVHETSSDALNQNISAHFSEYCFDEILKKNENL